MKNKTIALAAGGLLVATSLVGCGSSQPERHCEYDATDEPAMEAYCEAGVPGYEWEYEGESDAHRQKRLKARRTAPPRRVVVVPRASQVPGGVRPGGRPSITPAIPAPARSSAAPAPRPSRRVVVSRPPKRKP